MTISPEDLRDKNMLGIDFSTFEDLCITDGSGQGKLRTKYFKHSDKTPIKELQGTMSKSRFFGSHHWKTSFGQFRDILAFKDKHMFHPNAAGSEIKALLEKCKNLARAQKAERPIQWHMNPNFADYIPPKEIADKLVKHYLRTMECTYRIVHIPSFQREYEAYWDPAITLPTTSIVKILLVMAIGTCFYQEEGGDALRLSAQQWVYSAQSWISTPFEKGRLNLSGLQVYCLLLLARQTNAVGGDLLWIAAGSLLRTAFQMGFHRDPSYFPKISVMHGEMRRRLWATVLELTIQISLDSGMPPLIMPNDFDTQPPLNIDDEDLSEELVVAPKAKPSHVFTKTSIQIQLLKSLPTRHRITIIMSDFHIVPSYDDVLQMGAAITDSCKEAAVLFNSYPISAPRPSALQRNLTDMAIRCFLLAIHRLFAPKSQEHPQYYFSRKICLDTALLFTSYPCDPAPLGLMDDFTRLKAISGGFYRDVFIHAAMIICLEIIQQLDEDKTSGLPPTATAKLARAQLEQTMQDSLRLLGKRIELGENSVKGYLFLSAAMGQIEATQNGADIEEGITNAMKASGRYCLDVLKVRMNCPESPPVPIVEVEEAPGIGGFEYDFVMGDGSPEYGFDVPDDSWMFTGWEENPNINW